MSRIDDFFIGDEQQQQSTHFPIDPNVLGFSNITIAEITLMNLKNRTITNKFYDLISVLDHPTLTYKISLGFICACLCLLTITGNLLVLITFRRIRTVSIRKKSHFYRKVQMPSIKRK